MIDFKRIRYGKSEGIARVTLNEPERLNVLGSGPASNRSEIILALADAEEDSNIGAIIIDASGRAFCAGGDLSGAKRETPAQDLRFFEEAEAFHGRVRNCRKPVIAAVQGLCLGAGIALVAQCDLVIAADDASFGLPEGRMGFGGVFPLVPVVGPTWAKFLILTGERISAYRARQIGLVFAVAEAAELSDRTTELARRIAIMPRDSVILNKASINRATDLAGANASREAGLAMEPIIAGSARRARAADGRMFSAIITEEGLKGMIAARDGAYGTSWLRDDD